MDVISNFAARFERSREEELSIEDYLAECKRNPLAYATAAERMLIAIGEPQMVDTRNDTRMTIAGERLAVIAAVTLPITAISSVMGMNVIVNGSTHWVALGLLLTLMTGMSVWLLRWARKQGWW